MGFTIPVGLMGGGLPPGVVSWVSADVGLAVDGSNNVTSWTDRADGVNWTVASIGAGSSMKKVASGPWNSKPVVQNAGGTGTDLTYLTRAAVRSGTQPAHMFAVLKTDNPINVTTYSPMGWSTDLNSSHFVLGGGNLLYENFGLTLRQGPYTLADGGAACRSGSIYEITVAPSQWRVLQNNTLLAIEAGLTIGWNTTPRIFSSNPAAPTGFGMKGQIAEIIVYNAVLTGSSRNSVYNYLKSKYGVG